MRIKPDKALFEKMLKALKEQKKSEQWQKENGRFIPNPATWLNGGYWDNEVQEEKPDVPVGMKGLKDDEFKIPF